MRKIFGTAQFSIVAFALVAWCAGCSPKHSIGSQNGLSLSAGVCAPILVPGVQELYAVVKTGNRCAGCHFKGTSSAPANYHFADSLFDNAVTGFINAGPNRFYSKIRSAHFGGAGTTELIAVVDPLRAEFEQAYAKFQECKSKTGGGGSDTDFTPKRSTIAKTIPANVATATTITWQLERDLVDGGFDLSGAQFRISIQATTVASTGKTQYEIRTPTARGANTAAIQIRNIRIYLNGALVPLNEGGGTWTSLNNLAPSGRLHPLAQGTGVMGITADISRSTNTIAIGFGEIKVSTQYPDFNPSTYARLTSTSATPPAGQLPFQTGERVLSQRCAGCHGNSGGVSFAANGLQLLKLLGYVVPFSPESSRVYGLTALPSSNRSVMPPASGLAAVDSKWIRDWILDGAP